MRLTAASLIEHEFKKVFQSLLGTCATQSPCIDVAITKIGSCRDNQQRLIGLISRELTGQALNELPNEKAPDIDGYPSKLFKKIWKSLEKKW